MGIVLFFFGEEVRTPVRHVEEREHQGEDDPGNDKFIIHFDTPP